MSSELEVRDDKVRRRDDWQRWLLPTASAILETGGDTRATDASSDEAADTAVESDSRQPTPSPEVKPQLTITKTFRDAATKHLSTQNMKLPALSAPNVPAAAGDAILTPTAVTAPAFSQPVNHEPTAKPSQPSGSKSRRVPEASTSRSSDEDGHSEPEASSPSRGDGWKTPSLKGKERRGRAKKGEENKTTSVVVTHASSAETSTAPCCSSKDEQHATGQKSDETTVLVIPVHLAQHFFLSLDSL